MTRLALVIPTYGRHEAVADTLAQIADETKRLGILLYFSDDSRDDAVERVVTHYADSYENIYYRRNSPSLGHDRNVIQSLLWPQADYIWLLGDTIQPKKAMLKSVLQFLDRQDFIFLSRHGPAGTNIPMLTGKAAKALICEKLWNQTLTGVTIYSKIVCDWVRQTNPEIRRNFPQLSVILDFSTHNPASLGWLSEELIEYAPKKSSYWTSSALDVFVGDWVDVVRSYPDVIPPSALKTVLRSHSAQTNLFSAGLLFALRSDRQLSWTSVRRPHFWHVMHKSPVYVLAALILPLAVVRGMIKIADRRRSSG